MEWLLLALVALAAAIRLSTIDLQSFWFDEAFTPVHVLHPSIVATMSTISHTENTPPLWYAIVWVWTRIFGTGVVAMRLPSALAGIALVAVTWVLGRELAGRRAAAGAALIVACSPLFVWYSQEARSYELFALTAGIAFLCMVRAERRPTGGRMALFALAGSLALLSHYFAVFLLVPMALWLLRRRERWRVAAPAVGAIAVVGAALIPLLMSQGGKGTQWIGQWALSSRLEAIPQYFLTGYSGAPLGHKIELLVALPIVLGIAYGLWRGLERREADGALAALAVAACGVVVPVALAAVGIDFLAPRNLIGAMVPVAVLIAAVAGARSAGRVGVALVCLTGVGLLAISIDVDLSPRLQRGDWSAVAATLRSPPPGAGGGSAGESAGEGGAGEGGGGESEGEGAGEGGAGESAGQVIVTMHLGSAPLQYYTPALGPVRPPRSVRVSEVDEVGDRPLLPAAGSPPAPGFKLVAKRDLNGLLVYRFLAERPRSIDVKSLRGDAISEGPVNVLARGAVASAR